MTTIERIKEKICTFLEFNQSIPDELIKDYHRLRTGLLGLVEEPKESESEQSRLERLKLNNERLKQHNEIISNCIEALKFIDSMGEKEPKENKPKSPKEVRQIRKGKMAIENDGNVEVLRKCILYCNPKEINRILNWDVSDKYYLQPTPHDFTISLLVTTLPSIKASELIKIIEQHENPVKKERDKCCGGLGDISSIGRTCS